MRSDLRFVFRSLGRHRTFTIVTLFTLALGVGSAAAIFSVTDRILFRTRSFPPRVYLIGGHGPGFGTTPVRFDFMTRAYEQTNAMSEYAKAADMNGNVVIDGQPVATRWLGVTPNLLPLLGITPAIGRGFLPNEAIEGADHIVVLSDRFRRQYLADAGEVLGHKITLGGAVCTVVGVLPPDPTLPPYFDADIYRPLTYRPNSLQPWIPALWTLGRLNAGVTRDQAVEMLQMAKTDVPLSLRKYRDEHVMLSTLSEANSVLLRSEVYWLMVGAVGFLYAIACLNASNLMLARMLGQRRELSIRLALGAGRWRIVRLLAMESATLAVLGSVAGLLVANWLFPLLLTGTGTAFHPVNWTTWTLGWRVIGMMGLLTVATSLLIVSIPAYRILRTDIYGGLKEGGAALGESVALKRLRGGFVVLQAAFAVVLLAGAGLMIRTLHNLQQVDIGFDPAGRVKVDLNFPATYSTEWEPRLARLHEIQSSLLRVPGVQAVGFGNDALLPGYYYETQSVEGADGRPFKANLCCLSIGFQDASGLRLKSGRWLTEPRTNDVLISESLARACWPGQNPVGQVLRETLGNAEASAKWYGHTVAGVVGDVRSNLREVPHLYIYGPEGWVPWNYNTFIVRVAGDYTETLAGSIRRQLYAFDPQIVVSRITPVVQVRENQLWAERMADSILNVLAGIAALLTVVGLFSVLAYAVDRRMTEFGLRMALGATRGDLMGLVLRHGLLLAITGLALGVGAAVVLARYLRSLLYETSALDPGVLAAVSVVLIITALLACALPSYRASKVDVARLLKSE